MTIYIYVSALFLILVIVMLYYELASLRWEESERRLMERDEFELAFILKLLDAPDVVYLMKDREARRQLFLSFSQGLWRDAKAILEKRRLGPVSLLLALFFFLSFFLLRLKALVFCSERDLRFLSGVELVLVRSLG